MLYYSLVYNQYNIVGELSSVRRLSFLVTPRHPDFQVFREQSVQSRVLYNMVNAIARTLYFHNSKHDYGQEIYTIANKLDYDVRHVKASYSYMSLLSIAYHLIDNGFFTPAQTFSKKAIQQTIRLLAHNWASYWKLWNMHKKGKLDAQPSLPGYRKDCHIVVYNSQMLGRKWLKQGIVKPTPTVIEQGFTLPNHVKSGDVLSARLIPRAGGQYFELEVLYQEHAPQQASGSVTAGIDIGIDNLYTIAFDDFTEGLIVSGKSLKHINQASNYFIDDHRSKIAKHNITGATKLEQRWWENRRRRLYHEYTTLNNTTVDALIARNVGTVIIGWNDGFKKNSHMGRCNNREFVSLPHKRIVDNLAYKLGSLGINVILVEESYTSKASFIDNDTLPVFSEDAKEKYTFSGRRRHRGLYVTKHGQRINADLNAAYNIIRKHVPGFSPQADLMVKDAVVYPVHTLQGFHKH